jgi:hypothetical protein
VTARGIQPFEAAAKLQHYVDVPDITGKSIDIPVPVINLPKDAAQAVIDAEFHHIQGALLQHTVSRQVSDRQIGMYIFCIDCNQQAILSHVKTSDSCISRLLYQ